MRTCTFGPDPGRAAAPRLPVLAQGDLRRRAGHPFTVGARGPSGQRYRVLAAGVHGPGATSAAPTTAAARAAGLVPVAVALPLDEVESTVRRLLVIDVVVTVVVVALLAALALVVVRLGLRPLAAVGATAGAIAAGDLTHRVARAEPRTEVGRLGIALNAMLGQVERAFAQRADATDRLRRFVADASHELRTPLTSIRGFAELYRQGAVTGGDDLDRLMRRVEGEARRMGVLVDDLLLLARLDQGPSPARREMDLRALVGDAVHDARLTDPSRSFALQVPDGPVTVGADADRLAQVVVNLLANASAHTPAGTHVQVTLTAAGSSAVLEVADDGPGMTAQAAAHVFERFYRADPSRARASGGSGLGLSIAAAVVAAHRGTLDLRTAPGQGAAFTVTLPLAGVTTTGPG